MRRDILHVLIELLKRYPEAKGARVVSAEGLPIASTFPEDMDQAAAMTTALLSLAEKSVIEMKNGEFDQLYIKGSDGYILVLKVSPTEVLSIATTRDVRLGLFLLVCERTCEKIAKMINHDEEGFPSPYIFKSPSPPGDLGLSAQPQAKEPNIKQDLEDEPFCKYCGAELPKGQTICHVCGKKVI